MGELFKSRRGEGHQENNDSCQRKEGKGGQTTRERERKEKEKRRKKERRLLEIRDEVTSRDGGFLFLKDLLEGRALAGVLEVEFLVVFDDDLVEAVALALADQVLEAGLVVDPVVLQPASLAHH